MARAKQMDFISVQRAAEMLGLTEGRVRQLVGNHEDGELPATKLNKKAWMISVVDLRRYARHNKIKLKEVDHGTTEVRAG